MPKSYMQIVAYGGVEIYTPVIICNKLHIKIITILKHKSIKGVFYGYP